MLPMKKTIKPNSFSVFIKTDPNNLDKIQKLIESYKFNLDEAYWLKFKDKNGSFLKIEFKDISLENFIDLCNRIKRHADIEGIDVVFKGRKDYLLLLQDKGFTKYEELDYVDFRYKKKNVIIAVMKEDGFYKLKLQIIDTNQEIEVLFLQKLINRVFEIIEQRGD